MSSSKHMSGSIPGSPTISQMLLKCYSFQRGTKFFFITLERKIDEKFHAFSDFGTKPITKYKPRQIHDFLDYLIDECDLSNNTANHYAAMIIKVCKQAYKNQDIERVPDFTWKRVKNAHRMSYFTPEQVDQVVEYFRNSEKHNWMAPMVLIAANKGMRVGEILSISPNTIFANTEGKPYVHLMYTKNGDERYVYLNAKARQALRELDDWPKNHYIMYNFYASWKCLRRDVFNGENGSFSTQCDTPLPQGWPMSLGLTTQSLPK